MKRFTVIKFTDMSPLHIGMGRDSFDVAESALHSDTLSAGIAALRAQNGKTDDVKQFMESFSLSSAFPYWGDTLFLPKPAGRLPVVVQGRSEEQYRKLLKKVKFVARPLWKKLIQGDELTVDEEQLKGDFLVSEEDTTQFSALYKKLKTQRVKVPRDGGNAEPFTFEWMFFARGAGLYTILQCENPEIRSEVVSLLSQLGEQGVGSDRSVGGGHFSVETQELELPQVEGANAVITLSAYIPARDEIESLNLPEAQYQLMRRGGFISGSINTELRHLRKKTVVMFAPGSVFPCTEPLNGAIVDLRPQWNDSLHPVFRSGKPVVVQFKR